ncbi:replication-relaxation family protein [Streptomyces goshikiensis]
MAGRRLTNPAGSSNDLRGDVLRVLRVLTVATTDQIQRIAAPHLTYRHTTKPTASERKTARTASHAGALTDLRKHGLAENGGTTRAGETLRNLTTKGLEAASYELGRPMSEMGSTARGAGSSGATHPMSVNETVIALLRPKPDLRLLTREPADAKAAAQAAVDAPAGVGTIASYATEVPLPATGSWGAPGKGGAQADIVLTAPQDQVPLLFIEVDNCHETAEEIAAKLLKYSRFFNRTVPRLQELTHLLWAGELADGLDGEDHGVRHPPIISDPATPLRGLPHSRSAFLYRYLRYPPPAPLMSRGQGGTGNAPTLVRCSRLWVGVRITRGLGAPCAKGQGG